jgi:fructose-1-phosphate kinase PfkB-like protein
LENWSQRGHLVVDTYGPPLADLARQRLALLKINEDERRTLPVSAGCDPLAGVQRWIVTDGPRPVRFREAKGLEESITPPAVREISATGSGDVLLAGVIAALFFRRQSLRDAVAFAIPLAAANAAHPGVAEFEFPASSGNPASG